MEAIYMYIYIYISLSLSCQVLSGGMFAARPKAQQPCAVFRLPSYKLLACMKVAIRFLDDAARETWRRNLHPV